MEFLYHSIRKEIEELIEEQPYTEEYYQKIANVLNGSIYDLAALDICIPSKDSNLDECSIQWFFNQMHNKDKIKNIIIGDDIGSFITNPGNEYETFVFGEETRIVTIEDIDGNKQTFVSELHRDKIDSIIYCNTKQTIIPSIYRKEVVLKCDCGYEEKVNMPLDNLYHYTHDVYNRKLLQYYFPMLTPSQRELIQTNTCQKCWDRMFPYRMHI